MWILITGIVTDIVQKQKAYTNINWWLSKLLLSAEITF